MKGFGGDLLTESFTYSTNILQVRTVADPLDELLGLMRKTGDQSKQIEVLIQISKKFMDLTFELAGVIEELDQRTLELWDKVSRVETAQTAAPAAPMAAPATAPMAAPAAPPVAPTAAPAPPGAAPPPVPPGTAPATATGPPAPPGIPAPPSIGPSSPPDSPPSSTGGFLQPPPPQPAQRPPPTGMSLQASLQSELRDAFKKIKKGLDE